jgi:hypothetical protein
MPTDADGESDLFYDGYLHSLESNLAGVAGILLGGEPREFL